MKNFQYELCGHTLEIGHSETGSCDPWTLDYASELGVGLMVTADLATFLLIDNEIIYKFDSSSKVLKFIEKISNNEFETFDKFEQYLSTIATLTRSTLTESKKVIDKMKVENEKISKMTKEEKKEYFDSLRNERRRIIIEND